MIDDAVSGPDAFSDEERFFFDVNGYLVREGVLSTGEVDVVNSLIDAQRLPPPAEDLMTQRFSGMLEWGDPFLDLLDHPAVMTVLPSLVGDTMRLDHVYGIFMRAGTSGLTLHGGATPWDPSQYYVWRDGAAHNGLVGVMWGLSDSGPGDGGFCCIPGSHKANLEVPESVASYGAHRDWLKEVPLPKGSMLVFTEALCHGTLPWQGRAERRTVVYKYAPGHLAWNPPLGWPHDVFGSMRGLGTPSLEFAATLGGRRRRLLAPPSVAYRPSVVHC